MKKLILTVLALLMMPLAASAGVLSVSTEEYQAQMAAAHYVGVVEILDSTLANRGEKPEALMLEMTVRLFSDYRKKESAAPRDIKIMQSLSSCDLYPRKAGSVFEAIILGQEGKLSFASQPLTFAPGDIEKFRAETPFPEPVMKGKEKCESEGNAWSFPVGGQPECKIPAKDAGKICTISEECKGLCIAEFSKDAKQKKFETLLIDSKGMNVSDLEQKTGKCSSWTNMTGCHYVFEGQRVRHICAEF